MHRRLPLALFLSVLVAACVEPAAPSAPEPPVPGSTALEDAIETYTAEGTVRVPLHRTQGGNLSDNCVFLDGPVESMNVTMSWTASTPATASLVLRAGVFPDEERVGGPSPLRLELTDLEGQTLVAYADTEMAGTGVAQDVLLHLEVRSSRGDPEPRFGGSCGSGVFGP